MYNTQDTWLDGLTTATIQSLRCDGSPGSGYRVYTWLPTGLKSNLLHSRERLHLWVTNIAGPTAVISVEPAAASTDSATLPVSMIGNVPVVNGGELYRALFRGNGAYDWLKRNIAKRKLVDRVDYITEGCAHSRTKPFTTHLTLSAALILLHNASLHVISSRLKARDLCAWLGVEIQKRGDIRFDRTDTPCNLPTPEKVQPFVDVSLTTVPLAEQQFGGQANNRAIEEQKAKPQEFWTPTADVTGGGVPVLTITPGVSVGSAKGIEKLHFPADLVILDSAGRQDEPDNAPTTPQDAAEPAGNHEDLVREWLGDAVPDNAPTTPARELTPADLVEALNGFTANTRAQPPDNARDTLSQELSREPASNACLDADTGELIPREIDGFVIHQRAKDGYVNATAMCKAAGKLIGNWSQNAETKKVMASLAGSIGIPIDLLVDAIVVGPNDQRGTWVHPKVAIHLATWCSPDFYAQVINWVHDWVVEGKAPAVPAFNLPQTRAEALRQLADSLEVNEQLMLENAKVTEALGEAAAAVEVLEVKASELGQEVEVKDAELKDAETTNAELARLQTREKEAMNFFHWLGLNAAVLGGGPHIMIQQLKLLHVLVRNPVKSCHNTFENAICQDWQDRGILFYETSAWDKKKTPKAKTPEEEGKKLDAVLIRDEDGNVVRGASRVILIHPDHYDTVTDYILNREETLLRRLVAQAKSHPHYSPAKIINRLDGRYSAYEDALHSQFALKPEDQQKLVRIVRKPVNGKRQVWYIPEPDSKEELRVYGEGLTLQQALLDLAGKVKQQ